MTREDQDVDPVVQLRLREMLDFVERLSRWYDQMIALPRSKSRHSLNWVAGSRACWIAAAKGSRSVLNVNEINVSPSALAPYSYRSDPRVPPFPDDRPIFIFDAHCVLCSRWSNWFYATIAQDGTACSRPSLRSVAALYVHYGLDPENYETTSC